MPQIIDNINIILRDVLRPVLAQSYAADFCVGYFNLRGWSAVDDLVDRFEGGDGKTCRLLVGMQKLPIDDLREAQRFLQDDMGIDNQRAARLRKQLADEFRAQITFGAPTNQDEAGLRRLARQLRAGKLKVKLFLRHNLHAKLYLAHRTDQVTPTVGYVGSSNLTMAGLSAQGELSVDVVDNLATDRLKEWFNDRWEDRWSIDISDILAQIIEESWARESLIPPYRIYIKMAYHLSQEARAGLTEFRIPKDLDNELLEFQKAAVKIAAHHLNKRDGVLLGDVVGLGKTLMATAVARIFEEDQGFDTLILCPKNLVTMWEEYADRYRLHARVVSTSRVQKVLPDLRRYRLVILDESHNLRNREGQRYRIIQEYIQRNSCKTVLLSATPYNKTYLDLSNQLRLFLAEDEELAARPERLLREMGETAFIKTFQCGIRTLAAFEKSEYPDDWRELMRLYMVRRTRSFVQENYADLDEYGRRYLILSTGVRAYFPLRKPRTARFTIDESNPHDQYARLYAADVVDTINRLSLPRYGLGNFAARAPQKPPTPDERQLLDNLSRAGKRLMGFCRTNLFKRLESSGMAFLLSVERHLLRNYIVLHAIENGLPIPIGTQDAALLDTRATDRDEEEFEALANGAAVDPADDEESDPVTAPGQPHQRLRSHEEFQQRAAAVYRAYATVGKKRFKWIRPDLFSADLEKALEKDILDLLVLLDLCGEWDPSRDAKLKVLETLIRGQPPRRKVLVFSQFADTTTYLEEQLRRRGIKRLAAATGNSENPAALAWRFSPASNQKQATIDPTIELDVLIATDVLSEGQNLQDCSLVVNYDMPWAIIRLIQRVGRVDRIGQAADTIDCHSFLPADGVERIINLRQRLVDRLQQNAEVVGTDEQFFEGDLPAAAATVRDLYNEKAGILDGEADTEVDLASYAYQIWKNAIDADPTLQRSIEAMQPVLYSAKTLAQTVSRIPARPGVLTFVRTAQDNDSLVWLNEQGEVVSASQLAVLEAARCEPDTPALPRSESHHALVKSAVELVVKEESLTGGQLGRPSGARFKTYERLKRYQEAKRGTLFYRPEIERAMDDIYRAPLRPLAVDALNRQLRSGISDDDLATLVLTLRDEGRLTVVQEAEEKSGEPQIVCSLGVIDQ